jgi:hypothetical protein
LHRTREVSAERKGDINALGKMGREDLLAKGTVKAGLLSDASGVASPDKRKPCITAIDIA